MVVLLKLSLLRCNDPETGYGTVKSGHTWDFGEDGSFKVYGWGTCGGKMPGVPGGPILGWFSAETMYGFGRDAMEGTCLRLVSSIQISLSDFKGFLPEQFVGTGGLFSAGEIIY